MKTYKKLLSLFIVGPFLFQSCAPTLKYTKEKSDLTLPQKFPERKSKENLEKALKTSEKSWKDFFKDQKLIGLIEYGLKNSQEINILNQEINIANNEIMARTGEYLPKVGLGANYDAEKVGEFTSQGVSDKNNQLPGTLHNHRLGLYTTWEVDIWKKLRNASKAAYFRYMASQEAQKLAVTYFVAEIARSYYELIALDQELALIKSFIEVLKNAKNMVQYQQNAAKVTTLAVRRFEAEVRKNEGRQYSIQQEIVVTENKINRMLGRFPQPIERGSKKLDDIQPMNFKVGVPTDLLNNRPDIKQAQFNLEAAKLDVKSTKARFYPSLSIEAGAGYSAFNSKHLYDSPESVFTNIAANLTMPLLNRRAIKADYFSANNRQIQAIYEYEKTLLNAYAEVSNKISNIDNLNKIYTFKQSQVEALVDSVGISQILFKAARVDYVEALLTRRESLEAQVQLVEVKQQQLTAYIDLYRALGGGWKQ